MSTQEQIVPTLTAIYTQSLQDSSLPQDWLTANVAPIFKKGSKLTFSISNLHMLYINGTYHLQAHAKSLRPI